MFGFWEMLVYIGIVLVGLFYVWNKGVLDWSGNPRSATLVRTPAVSKEDRISAPVEGSRS